MNKDEAAELVEELETLRDQIAMLSDAVADCRARGVHQEALITRLKEQLRDGPRQGPRLQSRD